MIDVPVEHKEKAQLSKAKKQYSELEKYPLEDKYVEIVRYLLRHEWTYKTNDQGKVLAVDGSVFNHDQYFLADAKMQICELEFRKRYPTTWEVQIDYLIDKAKKSLENAI